MRSLEGGWKLLAIDYGGKPIAALRLTTPTLIDPCDHARSYLRLDQWPDLQDPAEERAWRSVWTSLG